MLILIEEEFNYLNNDGEESLRAKREMTAIMQKLTMLVLQLNRLSKEEQLYQEIILPEQDMAIIERFVERFRGQNIHE